MLFISLYLTVPNCYGFTNNFSKEKNNTFYKIIKKEPIIEHLVVYKKSFLDELVERFASIWEEEIGLD